MSAARKKIIIIKPAVHKAHDPNPRCIGCGTIVTPGMCYTGKMLAAFTWIGREKVVFNRKTGEHGIEHYKVPVSQYDHGYLCDDCAGNYHTATRELKNGDTITVPIVITDRLPVLTVRDSLVGGKSRKGFNTRITR